MTLDDFHAYVSVLNDRLYSHWRLMSDNHPDLWPLEMEKADWVEQLIAFVYNDCDEVDD